MPGLVEAWKEGKDKLELIEEVKSNKEVNKERAEIEHNRMIPPPVKLEVWKRDKGKCVICGSNDNLHFDHIIPFSKGGSSLVVGNIQLLCARHNIAKGDRIE